MKKKLENLYRCLETNEKTSKERERKGPIKQQRKKVGKLQSPRPTSKAQAEFHRQIRNSIVAFSPNRWLLLS